MLELSKFIKKEIVIVPIINGEGRVNGRKIKLNTKESGWLKLELGDEIRFISKASPYEIIKNTLRQDKKIYKTMVYVLGTEGVAYSFDEFYKRGLSEVVEINFIEAPLYSVALIIQWEDKRFYYVDTVITKNNKIIKEVKDRFSLIKDIKDVKGVTPELRYYFLLTNLQRDSFENLESLEKMSLSREEKEKRYKKINNAFPIRLKAAIQKAGGVYISHKNFGHGFEVEWTVGGQKIISRMRDDMRIINAGFCLSGEDKKHSISSIINLAKVFQKDKPLYITRE